MQSMGHRRITIAATLLAGVLVLLALTFLYRSYGPRKLRQYPSAPTSRYTDSQVGYSVEYPNDWIVVGPVVESYADSIWTVRLQAPGDESFRAIVVRVQPVTPESATDNRWVDAFLEAGATEVVVSPPDGVDADSGASTGPTVAGYPARQFESHDGQVMRTSFTAGGLGYSVVLIDGAGHDEKPVSEAQRLEDRAHYQHLLDSLVVGSGELRLPTAQPDENQHQ